MANIGLYGIGMLFWTLSLLIALCVVFVPFLQIDRNFHFTPGLSLESALSSWDPVMIEAVGNSVALSIIASLFAILCGAVLTRMLTRYPRSTVIMLALVYTVNPVTRAIGYRDLFTILTPFQNWMTALFGEWSAQMIILPALILGMHYLPIYLMRFLFVIRKKNVAHTLHGFMDAVFVSIPSFLRGFPISFAIFFLLTFFDYWVIQVISGGKALYWSQMFEQKAFVARDVGQAGMLIIIGLLMTLLAYAGSAAICSALRVFWKRLRPLKVAAFRTINIGKFTTVLHLLVCVFIAWPFLYSIIRFASLEEIHLIDGAGRAIQLTVVLSLSIALCSTVVAFILSAFFQEYPMRTRWWLPSLYFLALVPEAAYVLFSLFVTGLGFLKAGPGWLFFLVVSFSAPMSFFLWESLWGETEQRKLWMLAAAMRLKPFDSLKLAWLEWRRFFGITFVVNLWMMMDNVFITNFAAGPKWKPLSAIIFTSTKRGFQDAEFLTGALGSITMLTVIIMTILFTRQKMEVQSVEQ